MADHPDIARTLAAGRPRRRRPVWILGAIVIAIALGGGLWQASAAKSTAVTYTTEPAVEGPMVVNVTATGTVQPTTEVTVSSELSGTLQSVEVDYNDQIQVGQVLARLDDTKLRAQVENAEASVAAAKASVAQAEATAREALSNYQSQSSLDQRGISTKRDFIGYVAAHERADAAVSIAQADQTLAEANLVLQKTDLEKAVIRSPISGIVLDRTAEVGQIVASSLNAPTLFTLAEDLTRTELLVDIDEADIGRVAVGNEATFTVEAYPGRVFPATITQVRFASETTDGVVTYKAVLSVDNKELLLRPGMTATATITVTQIASALLAPNAALRYAPPQKAEAQRGNSNGLLGLIMPRRPGETRVAVGASNAVWVLRNGAPVRVSVTPGDTDGRNTVLAQGEVSPGDALIVDQTEAK
ncbi:MAG: efflux RND transporter periplasmic adaptor subunit [Cereibacter sphaeroides]|uniref:Efflux RND transporter periplasmic adaptor subunit n=1 Tax=Cereibacter sphaeroides TaxID=1063 RepID=A0A2W5SAX5_CERSP|nr:MAG: efflux RND transporter periplasmic adaptor subunit [Cereibacter sphaeroides]